MKYHLNKLWPDDGVAGLWGTGRALTTGVKLLASTSDNVVPWFLDEDLQETFGLPRARGHE